MTLRELYREFVVAKRRVEHDRQRDIHLAWQCVRVFIMSLRQNGYRLPSLRILMDAGPRVQTPAQMERTLRFLSEKTGFPLREVPTLG